METKSAQLQGKDESATGPKSLEWLINTGALLLARNQLSLSEFLSHQTALELTQSDLEMISSAVKLATVLNSARARDIDQTQTHPHGGLSTKPTIAWKNLPEAIQHAVNDVVTLSMRQGVVLPDPPQPVAADIDNDGSDIDGGTESNLEITSAATPPRGKTYHYLSPVFTHSQLAQTDAYSLFIESVLHHVNSMHNNLPAGMLPTRAHIAARVKQRHMNCRRTPTSSMAYLAVNTIKCYATDQGLGVCDLSKPSQGQLSQGVSVCAHGFLCAGVGVNVTPCIYIWTHTTRTYVRACMNRSSICANAARLTVRSFVATGR